MEHAGSICRTIKLSHPNDPLGDGLDSIYIRIESSIWSTFIKAGPPFVPSCYAQRARPMLLMRMPLTSVHPSKMSETEKFLTCILCNATNRRWISEIMQGNRTRLVLIIYSMSSFIAIMTIISAVLPCSTCNCHLFRSKSASNFTLPPVM